MGDVVLKTGRIFSCDRCGQLTVICSDCDRGHRYCSAECRSASRAETCRRAGELYRQSPKGRRSHRRRQKAYRNRRAAAAMGVAVPTSTAQSLAPTSSAPSIETPPAKTNFPEFTSTVTHHGSPSPSPEVTMAPSSSADALRRQGDRSQVARAPRGGPLSGCCSMCGRPVPGRVRYTFLTGEDPG